MLSQPIIQMKKNNVEFRSQKITRSKKAGILEIPAFLQMIEANFYSAQL